MNIPEYYNVQFDFECEWTLYEKEHNLDRPWMCQMPFIIGSTAIIIALAIMSATFYRFSKKQIFYLKIIQFYFIYSTTRT